MTQTVSSISRLGTESAFEVLARAEALTKNGHDIINVGIGQPDFKTADHIVEAAVKALRDGHHGYTPANGLLSLREAVSESIDTFSKVNVNPDQILIVPGGKVTMFFAIIMFWTLNGHKSTPLSSHKLSVAQLESSRRDAHNSKKHLN